MSLFVASVDVYIFHCKSAMNLYYREELHLIMCIQLVSYGLFTLMETDSFTNLDSKPDGYIVLCRNFHTAQTQIQIPILTDNYRNGIRV